MSLALIASYPKSGNTWMRVFLEAYCFDPITDINSKATPNCADRSLFQEHSGISSTDLTTHEANMLRPQVHQSIAEASKQHSFLKVHDLPFAREALFSHGLKVIYVVRNPLDVLVSATDFFGFTSHYQTALFMGDTETELAKRPAGIHFQIPQRLGSWSDHVQQWLTGDHGLEVHCCRYEDLYQHPEETFGEVISFLGIPRVAERFEQALQRSTFSTLQRNEASRGFHGRAPKQKKFFRRGRPGAGCHLPEEIQLLVMSRHRETMTRLGYPVLKRKT